MAFKLLRPDSFSVWKNEEIIKRFSKYKGIIDGNQIARYIVAKTLECEFNFTDTLENLEKLLIEKSVEFNELLNFETEDLMKREIKTIN